MAVYTEVSDEELGGFLAAYDIGRLHSMKGIAEGVENSNFLLHTERGSVFLTLFEKRTAVADLPYFIQLMEHLSAHGLACPQPVKTRGGAALSFRPASAYSAAHSPTGSIARCFRPQENLCRPSFQCLA